jgi:hypothetical protein
MQWRVGRGEVGGGEAAEASVGSVCVDMEADPSETFQE